MAVLTTHLPRQVSANHMAYTQGYMGFHLDEDKTSPQVDGCFAIVDSREEGQDLGETQLHQARLGGRGEERTR